MLEMFPELLLKKRIVMTYEEDYILENEKFPKYNNENF